MSSVVKSFRLWVIAMALVATVAIVQQPTDHGVRGRIQHLEQLVKCPSCENLSVYNSNSTSAIAVRRFIENQVSQGSSDTKILTMLESRYGSTILLSPSTNGLGVILWLAPVLVAGMLVIVFLRLRRSRQ